MKYRVKKKKNNERKKSTTKFSCKDIIEYGEYADNVLYYNNNNYYYLLLLYKFIHLHSFFLSLSLFSLLSRDILIHIKTVGRRIVDIQTDTQHVSILAVGIFRLLFECGCRL